MLSFNIVIESKHSFTGTLHLLIDRFFFSSHTTPDKSWRERFTFPQISGGGNSALCDAYYYISMKLLFVTFGKKRIRQVF